MVANKIKKTVSLSDMERSTPTFSQALQEERPLQIVGVLNPYVALLAERLGYKALYLSGAGVANASYGLPDLAVTTLDNVLEDAGRITARSSLPLLVDIDSGWGSALMIQRAVKLLERIGVAAVHIEDQVLEKRCGHRPNKEIVSEEEMCDRIKAAVDARSCSDFLIMARTDAFAKEGMEGMLKRCQAYKEAGADLLFLEALQELDQYQKVKANIALPVLANITEFGKTPLFTTEQLQEADIDMALYPLSAARSMYQAADQTLREIRATGSQKGVLETMQTRKDLYEVLDYHKYENLYDKLQNSDKGVSDGSDND